MSAICKPVKHFGICTSDLAVEAFGTPPYSLYADGCSRPLHLWHCIVVVKAYASLLVNLGLILLMSDTKDLKAVFTAFTLYAQHKRNNVILA